VKTKLLTDDEIAGTDINVDVADGVVTLRGRVSSEQERMRALELARSVEDVRSVEDELVVQASD
jgi:osmotically-inducible protein OsmY